MLIRIRIPKLGRSWIMDSETMLLYGVGSAAALALALLGPWAVGYEPGWMPFARGFWVLTGPILLLGCLRFGAHFYARKGRGE